MLPAANEVLLDRVRLRGTAAAIDAARAPLRTALDQTSWPQTAPGEFLFLRKLSVSGNPREIAAKASGQARRLADEAIDGWSPAAPDAPAVRFRSHSSLLACLLRDMLLGTASRCWYWRYRQEELQAPLAEAMPRLLQENPMALPDVVAALQDTTVWQAFWHELGNEGGVELLRAVAIATGWRTLIRLTPELSDARDTESAPASLALRPLYDLGFLACPATDSRPVLGAVLSLWRHAPTVLGHVDADVHIRQMARVIAATAAVEAMQERTSQTSVPADPKSFAAAPTPLEHERDVDAGKSTLPLSSDSATLPPASDSPTTAGFVEPANLVASRQPLPSKPGVDTPDAAHSAAAVSDIPTEDVIANRDVSPLADPALEKSRASIVEEGVGDNGSLPDAISEDGFFTQHGGLLYLLNFIKQPFVQALLPAQVPGVAWRWLYDLACGLGCPPEGELLALMAHECGVESGDELQQLPPLAPLGQLLQFGAARYGDEVWQPSTWRIPARVVARAGYIDLYFRLNDANLAVRRAGLDINPGWLPWLGRVVSFHYGSALEPQS